MFQRVMRRAAVEHERRSLATVLARRFIQRMLHPPRRALPTRAGLFALGAPIVLGVAAVNATNNLLFMLLGVALASIIVSGILSERNLRGIEVIVRPLGSTHAGEAARLEVIFRRAVRDGARRDVYGLTLSEIDGASTVLASLRRGAGRRAQRLEVSLPFLEGAQASRLALRAFERRGVARLGRMELKTRYPFGLLTKARDVSVDAEVLVRPRRVPVPRDLSDPAALAEDGDALSRRGVGLEIYGLRERDERDSVHRVHALRSLSLGREVVVETAGIERPSAWLGVLNLEGAEPEAFERTLEIATAAIEEWDRRGYSVGLVTARRAYPPNQTSLSEILDALAVLDLETGLESSVRDALVWMVPAGVDAPSSLQGSARRVRAEGFSRMSIDLVEVGFEDRSEGR